MLAVALAGVALYVFSGCGGGSGGASDEPKTATQERARPARPPRGGSSNATCRATGGVRRIDEGGDTVGEGQAYGMLIAAAAGTRSASTRSGSGPSRTCGATTG